MASPFSVFRKHRRTMMAVVAILSMIAFSIGSFTFDIFDFGRGSSRNREVARTKGGPISAADLDRMIADRQLANRFLGETALAAYGQLAEARLYYQFGFASPKEPFGSATEAAVVESKILADRARELGIVISNDAVNEFLQQVSQDKVTDQDFQAIVNRLGVSEPQVFAALRDELLLLKLQQVFSLQTTPAERWEYYRRLKLLATAELLPVRVADFLGEIADPPEQQLVAFFDSYKNQEPQPGSPEPGFKVPAKAFFQYLRADYEKFYDQALAAVPEEEIGAHYEEFKDRLYLRTDFGSSTLGESGPGPQRPGEAKPPRNRVRPPDAPEPPPDEPTPPAGATPPESPSGEPLPGDQGAAYRETPCQFGSVVSCEPQTADSSDGVADTALLVAPAADPKEKPSSKQPVQEAAAEGPIVEDAPAEKASAEKPSANEPVPEPAKEESTTAKPAAVKLPADLPPEIPGDLLLPPPDIREAPNLKYRPLWEVEDSIGKELARQQAAKKIDEVLRGVQVKMRRYASTWDTWSVDPENLKEPARLDFKALAAANGLTDHQTELVSAWELIDRYPDFGNSKVGPLGVGEYAIDGLQKYQSASSQDSDANRFLFWIIEQKESFAPDLDDVRGEVIEAWKLIQARKPALKRAQDLAAKARKTKQRLARLFGKKKGLSVTETSEFSWMTTGAGGAANSDAEPRLSEVEGVDDVGDEFMRMVFDLEVGEVGVAMNNPQTVACVVRVTSHKPLPTVLRDTFMADASAGVVPYRSVVRRDQRDMYAAWLDRITDDAQLEWVERPDDAQSR